MARAVISHPKRRAAFEPIYDAHPQTGASIEVFFADHWLAKSFGTNPGWFWWTCQCGCLPEDRQLVRFLIAILLTATSSLPNFFRIIAPLLPYCFRRIAP